MPKNVYSRRRKLIHYRGVDPDYITTFADLFQQCVLVGALSLVNHRGLHRGYLQQ